ncbi:hypothetical protein WR25_02316 isoform B [Diploscapter pachys]|uniref:Uncharacterized protein n=1 Tax=Diploscapter pachys TaxID=2018661 RepID=A0A2A2LCK2_9BILA|nr:hypothetical protein WR25_02316 isoform B [Diploscapter pachys]
MHSILKPPREPKDAPQIYSQYAETEKQKLESYIASQDKRIEEYEQVIKKLEDLPKKISYDAMLPICSVGFFHGRIVSTNEVFFRGKISRIQKLQITMSIGDNYFVECSAFEAIQSLKRRIQAINDAKSAAAKSFELATRNHEFFKSVFNPESGDQVEIREDYDEEKEREFREKRKAKKTPDSEASSSKIMTDEDLMKHLEALEMQEKENKEIEPDDEIGRVKIRDQGTQPPSGISKEEFRKLLDRLEASSEDSEGSDIDDEEGESGELDSDDLPEAETEVKRETPENEEEKPKDKKKKPRVRFAEEIDDKSEEMSKESETKPTSILKNTQPTPIDYEALSSIEKSESTPRVIPGSKVAFSGEVIERIVPEPFANSTFEEKDQENPAPKPVSKFKSSRAAKK